MDSINLILRMFGFAIAFYMLLEFIVACNISTKFGIVTLILVTLITLFIFLIFRKNLSFCDKCNQVIRGKLNNF